MAQWKYLIVGEEGDVTGTDEDTVAKDYSSYDQYTVINTELGCVQWIEEDGTEEFLPIEKADSVEGEEFPGEEGRMGGDAND